MTRFFAIISCLLLLMGLCVGASAADNTRATSVNIIASVSYILNLNHGIGTIDEVRDRIFSVMDKF